MIKKIKIYFTAFICLVNVRFASATDPVPAATNTDCNAALSLCEADATHSFNNNVDDLPCGSSFVYQHYYFYSTGGNFSLDVTFGSQQMNGFQLYGPLSNNLPDACEQFNSNSASLAASSNAIASLYSVTVSSNPAAGLYMLRIKLDICQNGTLTFIPKTTNFTCAPEVPCENCVASFELEPGKKYMISAWTKEEGAAPEKTSYDQPLLKLVFNFNTTLLSTETFVPSGVIIDGWQRMEGEFTVPLTTNNMEIRLEVLSGEAFFDDIRIFPFDGSMKSYVYDPVTLRLAAELDERNYATIYEYDEEGKLVRVKKETERGVMTIQENKTFIKKKTD